MRPAVAEWRRNEAGSEKVIADYAITVTVHFISA
jgi:hypothetical protein